MRFKTWIENNEDEEIEDLYRFMPERLWSPEQRQKIEDWQKRKKESELAAKWREQDQELANSITLQSPFKALWGIKKHPGSDTSSLGMELGWYNMTLEQIIKTTYEQIKKAMWEVTARGFGYSPSMYIPLPPRGWNEMGDQEKRIAIHNRSLSHLRSAIYDIHRCLNRFYRDPYDPQRVVDLPPLPQPVIGWINYLWDELSHDEEMDAKDKRDQEALRAQDERWAQQAKQQEDDAQLIAAALWKARKKLPYWNDATKEDAIKTARDFLKASPYERGQFSKAIRDIAAKALNRRITTKFHYMEPEEAGKFVQRATSVNLENESSDKLAEVYNKTVGITNNPHPDDPNWSEDVHPGLGAEILGKAAMLKIEAADEIKKRLRTAHDSGDEKTMREIYYALDAENRKFFFKQSG